MIDKVKIGGTDYQVQLVERLKDDELYGDIDHMTSRIRINSGATAACQEVTLWHEIVHGILAHAGYEKHSEPMVIAIAYGVCQVLRDNPEITRLSDGKTTD